jgi:hypothetical protein
VKRILFSLLLLCAPAEAASRDPLLNGFRTPPAAAKPRVWWHWMNGNITKDGIRKDLDWMKRIGIGGVDAIDASIETPQVVDKRLVYMTPEWKDAFRYAARLADMHGMELAVDSSPGWSETGGPWVGPQAAMKKLVWSRTPVEGAFHGILAPPPSVTGPFQNIARGNAAPFYRDALVVAYRATVSDPQGAGVASTGAAVDTTVLQDGDLANGVTLMPAAPDAQVWLRMDYGGPQTIQALTLALSTNDGLGFAARVEASDNDRDWHAVADVPRAAQVRRFALPQQTIAFAPVTARYFRLVVRPGAPIPNSLRIVEHAPGLVEAPAPPAGAAPRFYTLHELVFHAQAMVGEFEKKAGFAIARDNYAIAATAPVSPGSAVRDVVDVTGFMKSDGRFEWTPPPGRWVVLRLGYSLTGSENHPATKEATGLEVDKLNRAHVRDYMEHYLDTYARTVGPSLFGKRGLTALMVDSTEVGAQNWTESMLADFKRLRGYDPLPYLPALTGLVVNSAAESDRFLWDWRRTIAQLLSENHYGEIARIARERGLTDYAEALEDHRPTFGDDIEMRSHAAIPTAAMWAYGARPLPTYVADIQGAASVANVYGRKVVAAESLTSAGQPWTYSPRSLKPVVDLEFATGINRIIVHTSVHQPVDKPPGLSLGAYGQFFNRLESWADMAGGWMRYIARCSYLLQQGRHAADIAYFYGEEAPITGLFGDKAVDVPQGYGFDFVGADAVLRLLSVDKGEVVTQSGMRYRLIYLGGSSRLMTLPVLLRLRELVEQGAVLVGEKPQGSPSLADDGAIFQAQADMLFGAAEGRVGKGRIFAGLPEAFAALKLAPDFEYAKPKADTQLLSVHRTLEDGELYFISNRGDRAETVDVTLRAGGLQALLLDAVTGGAVSTSVTDVDGRSRVSLSLPAYGSVFVLLRKGAPAPSGPGAEKAVASVPGPWRITFQPGRGAPPSIEQKALQSWSQVEAAKYFSGTATYTASFTLPALRRDARLMLDLGDVHELANVTLNGKPLGTVWTAPFALDIGKAARRGRNALKIEVANLWVNRLIGDAQPGARRSAFTTIPTYRADAPLRPSGLLGPVTIRQVSH